MKQRLSKKVQELLTAGTPKQKAALICADADAQRAEKAPLLTDEEVAAIRNSFRNADPKEAKEYNRWLSIHEAMNEYAIHIVLAANSYLSYANELMEYIRVWEAYTREEEHINALIDFTEDNTPKKLEAFRNKVSLYSWPFAKAVILPDGYLQIDIDGEGMLYDIIKAKRENCIIALTQLKAIVTAFEEWVRKKKAQPLIPQVITNELSRAKADVAQRIAPAYSEHTINKHKAKGYVVTPADEKRAVFPDYDTTPADPTAYEKATDYLNDLSAR